MSDLRKEATNLKALLSEAYENGARTAADEITSLRAQLASARKALEPFAKIAPMWDAYENVDAETASILINVRLQDLRNTRTALTDENGK